MRDSAKILCLLLLAINSYTAAAEEELSPTITTKTDVEMVLIPAGWFTMGDNNGPNDEKPQHEVFIRSFYIDKYEVTQSDYLKTTGTNPSKFGGKDWKIYPVDRIGWRQAAAYCNERSRREGLQSCYDEQNWQCDFKVNGYRLPTEAEWEYAYRAGTTAPYYFGSNANNQLKRYAWFKDNSNSQTQPVGQKKTNRWGLYDMAGNVYEWCNDYYDPNYYKNSPDRDPRGPQKGEKKVLRGGCWVTDAQSCRAASRASDDPANADICLGYPAYGFRCVRKANNHIETSTGSVGTTKAN